MGFQFLWNDAYKDNPNFGLDYFNAAQYGFYKVSDEILTEEDLVGQTVTYREGYDGRSWEEWKLDVITGGTYYESGSKKIIQAGPAGGIISGPAGDYLLWDHPLISSRDVYARLPESGTYIRRSNGNYSDLQIQSVGLYDEFDIDWGYTDYGDDERLNKNTLVGVLQDSSIAGAFRCQIYNAKDYEEFRFRWYKKVGGSLVKEDDYSTRKYSDFVPPTGTPGATRYYCVANSISMLSHKTGYVQVEVVPPPYSPPADKRHIRPIIQGWLVGKRLAAMRRAEGGISVTSRLGEGVLGYMRLGE